MAEAGPPHDNTPLAADDMIGSLATQVRELSLRVAELQGELEAARRRIGVYEDFDAQVQDSLSAALRAANQIRERARVSAEAIADEARAQRPASVAELDAMRIERDALRRAIEEASSTVPARVASPVPVFPMSELRSAATEALRGVFKELVAEIRALPVPEAPSTRPADSPPTQAAASSPRPAAHQPDSSRLPPPPTAAQAPFEAPPAQRPSSPVPAPAPAPNIAASAAAPEPSWSTTPPPPSAPYAAPPSSYNAPQPSTRAPEAQPLPRPTVVPPQERPERSFVVEDVDVAPAAAAPAPAPVAPAPAPAPMPAPQPAPAPAAAEPAREPWVPTPSEPIGEVQVVLSPISSFPRLVELERRLQGMPVVRTVYARDFRNGVATLAIGLRHPMTVDEFATAVTKLDYPRLRIVSTSGYVLELRIDTEASSIA